jgi:hypothetical protein
VGKLPRLTRLRRMSLNAVMEIDAATRRNLELTRTLSGERRGSLLDTIDRCVSAGGSRLLSARLSAPVTDVQEINRRLDEITALTEAPDRRVLLRETLRTLPDMERALARLSLGRGSPRDLGAIRDGLNAAQTLSAIVSVMNEPRLERILTGLTQPAAVKALADTLCGRAVGRSAVSGPGGRVHPRGIRAGAGPSCAACAMNRAGISRRFRTPTASARGSTPLKSPTTTFWDITSTSPRGMRTN